MSNLEKKYIPLENSSESITIDNVNNNLKPTYEEEKVKDSDIDIKITEIKTILEKINKSERGM